MMANRGLALGFAGWLHCVSLAHQEKKAAAMKRALSYFLNKERAAVGAVGLRCMPSASQSSRRSAVVCPTWQTVSSRLVCVARDHITS